MTKKTIAKIINELSQPLPAGLVKTLRKGGQTISYIPHYIVKKRLNEICPDWQGEVKQVLQVNGKVAVVYRLTIAGVSREAVGYEDDVEDLYGDPFSNAEAMAFKRAAAWFGLGLYLYDKDQPKSAPSKPVNGNSVKQPKTLEQWRESYELLQIEAAKWGIDPPDLPPNADIATIKAMGHDLKQQWLAAKRAAENKPAEQDAEEVF